MSMKPVDAEQGVCMTTAAPVTIGDMLYQTIGKMAGDHEIKGHILREAHGMLGCFRAIKAAPEAYNLVISALRAAGFTITY